MTWTILILLFSSSFTSGEPVSSGEDYESGRYLENDNKCNIYYQSISTIHSPNEEGIDCECLEENTAGYYDLLCKYLHNFTNQFHYDQLSVNGNTALSDISENAITKQTFGNILIRRLMISKFKHLKIEKDAFVNINSLESLDISYNNASLTDHLLVSRISTLKTFALSGNRPTQPFLKSSIDHLTQLRELYVYNCQLKSFPHIQHDRGSELEVLAAGNNRIDQSGISNILRLPNLQELDLTNNSLGTSRIDYGIFKKSKTLIKLSLAKNELTTVPKLISSSLKILDLSQNMIYTFDTYPLGDLTQNIPLLSQMYMYGNDVQYLSERSFCLLSGVNRIFPLEIFMEMNSVDRIHDCAFSVPLHGQLAVFTATNQIECGCGVWLGVDRDMLRGHAKPVICSPKKVGFQSVEILVSKNSWYEICVNRSNLECPNVCMSSDRATESKIFYTDPREMQASDSAYRKATHTILSITFILFVV